MFKIFGWLEKGTRRLDKLILKITLSTFAIGFIGYLFLYTYKDDLTLERFLLFEEILSWAVVIGFMLIPIVVVAKGVACVKHGFHNLKKCDDEIFENIDYHTVVSQADYISKIKIINYYYQDNGNVDKLCENKEIDRLYARKDFLSVRKNLYNDLTTYFYSLVISIIASFFCDTAKLKDSWQLAINIGVVVIAFFIAILMKYVKRGQDGSFSYQIEEFELRLLENKIHRLEDKIAANEDVTKILITRQYVIKELQKCYSKAIRKKAKEVIHKDIDKIRQLQLSLDACSKYELRKVFINDYVGYLAYVNDCDIADDTFVNDDFRVLYQIICKYFSTEEVEQERKYIMKPNEKHLEFLQNNIGRMNQCSFHMKGWAITLASALIAVFVSTITKENPGNKIYIYAAIVSTALFWILDSLYLSKERKFIAIYNDVIGIGNGQQKLEINEYEIPLSKYTGWKYSILRAMLLPSEIVLYGLIIVGLVVFCICV